MNFSQIPKSGNDSLQMQNGGSSEFPVLLKGLSIQIYSENQKQTKEIERRNVTDKKMLKFNWKILLYNSLICILLLRIVFAYARPVSLYAHSMGNANMYIQIRSVYDI